MQDRPTISDLIEAIQEYLTRSLLPVLERTGEDELAYKALVSWNMLGVIQRELRSGEELLDQELEELEDLLPDSRAAGGSSEGGRAADSGSERRAIPEGATYLQKMDYARRLNRQLAEKICREKLGPAQRDIWQHVYKNVKRKIAVVNPRFTLD